MSSKLNLTKYKRLAKYMQLVIRVFLAAMIICVVIAIGIGAYVSFTSADSLGFLFDGSGRLSLSIDNVLMFKINSEDATFNNLKPVFISICFMAGTLGVMLAIILRQLDLILGTVKNDIPFAPENSRRLTIIGITLMVGAFIKRIGEFIVALTIIDTLKLFDLSANYSPDSNMIIMGFIVLILAGVFKYGSYLQNEYDSTV